MTLMHEITKGRNLALLLLGGITLAYLLFDTRGLVKRLTLTMEKGSIEKKITLLQKQNSSMQIEIHKLLTSDKEIERIAREKYFMHRNGEKIIKVEPR